MSEHERLVGLLRRLLRLNDDLRTQNEYLRKVVHQLTDEHRSLREKFAKYQDDRAIETAAADALFGSAMDELLVRRGQEG
jgi:peptidoglycan hydrolase CwlO-like protein